LIWNQEPFADRRAFVSTVEREVRAFPLSPVQRAAIVVAAATADVGRQVDNSCADRIALTFDDGTSIYRPAFGGSNPAVQRLLIEMGYTYFLNRINGEDWLPDKGAAAIRDDIVAQLRPGVIIGMHDGPIDTPAGAATVQATAEVIDQARARGYCFGVVDSSGQVVADRYVSSGEPVPPVTAPVPYHLPLAFGTVDQLPQPWVAIP
jgi:peptidoglycan/xylan/chitin deacetylase (PgdA/CDA1 family)